MPDLSLRKLTEPSPLATALAAALGTRSIALVGMMGAGKSLIGRRLSKKLDVPSQGCPPYPAAPMLQEVCNERGRRPSEGGVLCVGREQLATFDWRIKMSSSNRMKEARRVGAARRRSLKLSMIGLPSEGDAGLRG